MDVPEIPKEPSRRSLPRQPLHITDYNAPDSPGQLLLFEGAPPLHVGQHVYASSAAPIETIRLCNGLTVHFDCSSTFKVELICLVRAGANQDPPGKNGVAHLLEHLLFCGSGDISGPVEFAIARARAGIEVNAFTARHDTIYSFLSTPHSVGASLDLLCSILSKPRLAEHDFMMQKDSIVRAERHLIARSRPTAEPWQFHFTEFVHGPWGKSGLTLGTAEDLAAISHRDVVEFWERQYHAGNMEVLVSGPISRELVSSVREKLGGLRPGPITRFQPFDELIQERPDRVLWQPTPGEGALLMFSFPSFAENCREGAAAHVLRTLINRSSLSPFFRRARLEEGLLYHVEHGRTGTPESTFDEVFFLCEDHNKINPLFEVMTRALDDFASGAPVQEILASTHNGTRGLPKIDALQVLRNLAFFGPSFSPDELDRVIRTLSPDEIADVARKIFDPGKAKVAIFSPAPPFPLPSPWYDLRGEETP